MQLNVNGKLQTVDPNTSLAALLELLDVTEGRFAVEVNGEIVPKGQHQDFELHDNDAIEIVRAIGGKGASRHS